MHDAPFDPDALYRTHHRMVRRRVRRFVHAEERVQDLVQEVFERALRHADTFEGRSSVVTWLYQIATRVCLHDLRNRRRRKALLEHWGAPVWSRPNSAADPETTAFLGQVWTLLDEEQVEIGTYHFVDGLSHEEIAQILGCSRRTVGNRVMAIREQVRSAAAREVS